MNYEEVRDIQVWIMIISGAGGIVFFLIISLFMFKVNNRFKSKTLSETYVCIALHIPFSSVILK